MADAFEDETEQTMTMNEYIEKVEAEELEADLVLGGDEGKECTYAKGYMKRQAIFSCLTCVPEGVAGVCTACSLTCHDGHEVVELWTKRNFKCDCGNSKFRESFCKLFANKDPENLENSYNQNFKGAYCTCARPYPDPDIEEQVEMIQCCICEDWFHEDHLGLDTSEEIPRDEEGEPVYEDFICQECSVLCPFVKLYPPSIWVSPVHIKSENITKEEGNVLENGPPTCFPVKIEKGVSNSEALTDPTTVNSESVTGHSGKDSSVLENSENNKKCKLGVELNSSLYALDKKKPMFLSKGWRDLLCRCEACQEFYTQKKVGFLIDKDDTIEEYERIAKQKREESKQKQVGDLLNNFNHVQKIEFLSGIADFQNEMHSFLESFDNSRPITSADVHQIFDNLAKKRQRTL
ncbi:hypothetical protein QJS04_geneDACA011059 [Acorus gramineus]|uniref:UBR-type domain-containing protein n=1 Tax=Acorus gramineus TaxID=55184 RepID=A0AAV9BFU4_ACOGR|nr:hypothetical protein QJS04_geneDACA011059 [Acorus gramineus]